MTRFFSIIFAVLASLSLAACDDFGRKYPPGYTDDGIKFEEDGWHYMASTRYIMINYYPATGVPRVTFQCAIPNGLIAGLDPLKIRALEFEPLQQWPQPELAISVGGAQAADLPSLTPGESATRMEIMVRGRTRTQLLSSLGAGDPIVLTFGNETREYPGVPQSMREAFERKCQRQD